jgi:UDP-2,3-diacylglucosamine pyrophosphatase LpxH
VRPDIVARALQSLIISDLHLGNWARHDVLRLPAPRQKLLDALAGVDRLVLLGDITELMTRHPRRPLAVAEPILREIGQRLGSGREVIIVPGNHDAPLVRAWARAQGDRLTTDSVVDPNATRVLARVVSWLAPARVRVHYPGVWLEDRVWATHGHYLDRHLMPESAFGVLRGWGAGTSRDRRPARPIDYERHRTHSKRGRDPLLTRFLDRPLGTLLAGASEFLRSAAMPALPQLLMNARLTPVTAAMIDFQMRRASIPAIARVARRLGVDADWVIFGHVHRAGPLAGESTERWRPTAGSPRFLNTGSWLYEPLLIDRSSPPHPYWPGGAVVLKAGREPRVVGLLDGIGREDLHRSAR